MYCGFDAIGFAALGEAPGNRIVMAGAATVTVDWAVTLYAGRHEYISRPSDSPVSQLFLGTLEKAYRIERSVLSGNHIGEQITIGLGEVTLYNKEGDYDFLAVDHTAQGQAIELKMGDRRKPLRTWRTVLKGFMTVAAVDRDKVTFTLRDAGYQLDVAVSSNVYAGTGGVEGTEDLLGRRKPKWFGWVKEVAAPLVMPSDLTYQLNDGPIHQVQSCHVRGVDLTFSADYLTVEALNAATLSIGYYATCLAHGFARIAVGSGSEIGQVTWDFAGDKAGGVFVETTADIVRRMLSVTTVEDPAGLVTASFEALNDAQAAPVGYGVAVGSDETVAVAVGRLMAAIGGWCGAKRTGRFEVRRLEDPANGASSGSYDRTNTGEQLQTVPMPSDLSPPPWRIRVGWGRVWTPGQTDLAGSVSEERRAFLAQEVRYAVAESESVRADFPPGHEWTKPETFFRDESDAQAEADRLGELFWPARVLYEVPLAVNLPTHELGQVVTLQFKGRFNLDTDRKMAIVRVTDDDQAGTTLTVWG